jgi:hypothetical protein
MDPSPRRHRMRQIGGCYQPITSATGTRLDFTQVGRDLAKKVFELYGADGIEQQVLNCYRLPYVAVPRHAPSVNPAFLCSVARLGYSECRSRVALRCERHAQVCGKVGASRRLAPPGDPPDIRPHSKALPPRPARPPYAAPHLNQAGVMKVSIQLVCLALLFCSAKCPADSPSELPDIQTAKEYVEKGD